MPAGTRTCGCLAAVGSCLAAGGGCFPRGSSDAALALEAFFLGAMRVTRINCRESFRVLFKCFMCGPSTVILVPVSKLDDMHSHMYGELWLRCFVCLRSLVMAPVSFVGPLHNSMSDESFPDNWYLCWLRPRHPSRDSSLDMESLGGKFGEIQCLGV